MERTARQSAILAEELRNVVNQTEALLQAISADGNDAIGALRERVHSAVDAAKSRLDGLEMRASRSAQRASAATEVYVRENPWTVVGAAAAAGLLLGGLFTRSLGSDGERTV